MPIATLGWLVAGLTCLLLAIVLWHRFTQPKLQALLILVASAGVTLAVSGTLWSLVLLGGAIILAGLTWWIIVRSRSRSANSVWIAVLLFIFVLTKLPFSAHYLGPTVWIGISYLFLRLMHMTLEARQGRLEDVTLSQMVVYLFHPATLVAGPIDRIQHSVQEQSNLPPIPNQYFNEGFWRIFTGLIKKFILANTFYGLTLAFDAIHGLPPVSGTWIWLFAYSFYIYFDFAAYSDVAIGAGLLLGMRLPENFANPYFQSTITQFWQAWHITLSTWLRDYVFFPTSRSLLRRFGNRFSPLILLISHLVTMITSGLWHGFQLGLIVWGLWHGLGLYAHNRWTILRRRYHLPPMPTVVGIAMTYIFVSFGWIFFSMSFTHAFHILVHLFGFN